MFKKYLENKRVRTALWVLGIVIVVLFMWSTAPRINKPNDVQPTPSDTTNVNEAESTTNTPSANVPRKNTNTKVTGFTEKRAPHFVSANIANNATLINRPLTVTLTFDSLLTRSTESFITVKRDQIYSATMASSSIAEDGKTLVVSLNQQVASGNYYVYYVACFADTGCKDGRFGYRLKLP